ncbi:MAG TPA: hypothetical protein VG033_01175, partial [Candidatus Acidoferrales bacterium]|nr:hypothetical protein [Candidatus Acidoferrales bacterium]
QQRTNSPSDGLRTARAIMFIGLAPIQEVSRIRAAEASGDGTFPLWAHRMKGAGRFLPVRIATFKSEETP